MKEIIILLILNIFPLSSLFANLKDSGSKTLVNSIPILNNLGNVYKLIFILVGAGVGILFMIKAFKTYSNSDKEKSDFKSLIVKTVVCIVLIVFCTTILSWLLYGLEDTNFYKGLSGSFIKGEF